MWQLADVNAATCRVKSRGIAMVAAEFAIVHLPLLLLLRAMI